MKRVTCRRPQRDSVFQLAALMLGCAALAVAQNLPAERIYGGTRAELEKALRDVGAYSKGRLPTLEGFVGSVDVPLERLERPQYQFHIEFGAAGVERTTVRLSATITAWYADPDPSRSVYRMLPSNGRLEADLFDRLDEYLKKGGVTSARRAFALAAKLPAIVPPAPGSPAERLGEPGVAAGMPAGTAGGSEPAAQPAGSEARATPGESDPSILSEEIARTRSARETAERQLAEVLAELNELEKALRGQAAPQNLALIKAARAAVRASPSATAPVLFFAQPEDTFEIIENRGDWIELNLGAGAQGWVQGSQAHLAADLEGGESVVQSAPDPPTGFEVTREEITAFSGEWAELKSQRALFIWVRPVGEVSDDVLSQRQLIFAKQTFAARYAEASHAEPPFAGVVVVFLSGKGGVAAATVGNIGRWRSGILSEGQFLRKCSLDPPEAFRNSPER